MRISFLEKKVNVKMTPLSSLSTPVKGKKNHIVPIVDKVRQSNTKCKIKSTNN